MVRPSFDAPYDDTGNGGSYGGPQWDESHFGGYGNRVEWQPDENGVNRPVVVGTGRGDYVARYRGLGAAAANRDAYKLDFTKADEDRARGLQAREGQVQAAGMLRNAAEGMAPSRAEIMSQGGIDQGTGAALAGGANARGLAAAAQAQRMGMQQGQQGQMQAVGQTVGQRADELGTAQDAFTRGAGAIRGGDYASQSQMQKQAAMQMQSELEQRRLNQQAQLNYEKLAFGVNKAEMDADIARRGVYAQRDAMREQQSQANKDQQAAFIGSVASGGGAMGSAALSSGGGPGGGGGGGGGGWGTGDPGGQGDKWERDRDTAQSDVRGKSSIRILSDDRTKLASAWDKGYEAAIANVDKQSRKDPASLAQAAKLREGQTKDDESSLAASAARDIKGRAWDEGQQDAKALYTAKGRNEAMAAMYEAEKRRAQIEGHRMVPNGAGGRLSGIASRFRHPGTLEYEQADATRAAVDNAQAAVVRSGQRMQSLDPVMSRGEEAMHAMEDQGLKVLASSDVRGKEHTALLAEADRQIANYRGAASKPTSGMSPKEQAMMDEADRQIANYKADDRPAAVDQKGDAMMRDADEQIRNMKEQEKAPPAVGAALARGLQPYQYEYKPGFREREGQKPGEKNIGPMAQNMASNPITGSAVGQGEDGLLYIDMPKATKLSLGGIGYLAQQQREQENRLRRLEKGSR